MQTSAPVRSQQSQLLKLDGQVQRSSRSHVLMARTYRLFRSQSGSTAVEYAVMLGAVCSLLLTSVRAIGNSSTTTFDKITAAISSSPDSSAAGAFKAAPDPAGGVSIPPGS
ncbi:MAG: Flp family type IVb pilin [Planctomycetes bacterium]|nr:Flp family type IVb pilin [Planctomycetota bacterium]